MKNAGFGKRLLAYILDTLIISIVASLIIVFIPMEEVDTKDANNTMESYLEGEITANEYIKEVSTVNYELEQSRIPSYIVSLSLMFIYFVIVQYKLGGQTVGKKILNIKVESTKGKLNVNQLIFRSLIINEIAFNMLNLVSIFVFKNATFSIVSGVLNMANVALILICAVMVIANKDKRGLHDMIAKTKVVELKN